MRYMTFAEKMYRGILTFTYELAGRMEVSNQTFGPYGSPSTVKQVVSLEENYLRRTHPKYSRLNLQIQVNEGWKDVESVPPTN